MSTELQYAWAAGFLDGEGYIGIQRKLGRNRWRKDATISHGQAVPYIRRPTYKLTIAAAQRNRASLIVLRDLFGGLERQRKVLGHEGVAYFEWSLSSGAALACLEAVFPYLVNKRPVAALAIEFGRWYLATKTRPGVGLAMTEERRQRAGEFHLAVQQINRTYRTVPPQTVIERFPLDADGCVRDSGVASRTPLALVVNGGQQGV